MELKQAVEKILPHYEKALIEMPKEDYDVWLLDNKMSQGICYYAYNVHKISIYDQFKRILGGQKYIGGGRPLVLSSYEYNLNQIQIRVDWMREYLAKH